MNNEEKIIRCLELTKHLPFTTTQWMEVSKKLYDFINLTVTECESESENKDITEKCMDMCYLEGANRFYRKLLNKSLIMNYRKIITEAMEEFDEEYTTYLSS